MLSKWRPWLSGRAPLQVKILICVGVSLFHVGAYEIATALTPTRGHRDHFHAWKWCLISSTQNILLGTNDIVSFRGQRPFFLWHPGFHLVVTLNGCRKLYVDQSPVLWLQSIFDQKLHTCTSWSLRVPSVTNQKKRRRGIGNSYSHP